MVPWLQHRELRKHIQPIEQFVYRTAAERWRTKCPGMPRALLDIFKELPNASPSAMSAHVVTFMFASHDTTAHTMGFLLYEISRHTEMQGRLSREIDEVIGDITQPDATVPTCEQVSRFSYCTQVVDETLRLYPVAASGSIRRVDSDGGHLPHSGFPLSEGTAILMPPIIMHRSPEYWDSLLELIQSVSRVTP